jgi:hypothetical protein
MSRYESGVYRQMAWEAEVAGSASWDVRIFTSLDREDPAGIFERWGRELTDKRGFLSGLLLRRDYYRWIRSIASNYDVVMVRHTVHDPLRPYGLRKIPSHVASVHHTLEGPELQHLGGGTIRGWFRYQAEKVLGAMSISQADTVVAVTAEIASYETGRPFCKDKQTIIYPNGVMMDRSLEGMARDERGSVPELLFVAGSFQAWQGLDLVLEALAGNSENCVLHVVGEVSADLLAMVSDPRVRVHGSLSELEIADLVARSWIGLSSFGLMRKGMKEACTLKVRQYLAGGLPVYAGHVDVFPPSSAIYRNGKAELSAMLDFANQVRALSRTTVRNMAHEYIDKRELSERLRQDLSVRIYG